MASAVEWARPRVVDRYLLLGEIGSGGMARVHWGRHVGPMGFCRTVAIKRLHAELARDPEFVAMFLDEARLAARVQHPNVVSTLDVVTSADELFVVMDYVHGETLARLVAHSGGGALPAPIVCAVMTDALYGLQAAHDAKDPKGQPLRIVHRDVSPQNIMVGLDGVTRMLDFGVAKASMRSQVTRDGQVKGKLAYMAPEQIRNRPVDRRADVFAAAIVTWELLTGERLFSFDDPGATVHHILNEPSRAPSELRSDVSKQLDEVVLRGLNRRPEDRFADAREMAAALERACVPASDADVGRWAEQVAGDSLAARAERLTEVEAIDADDVEQEVTSANHAAEKSEIRSLLRELLASDERAEMPTAVTAVPSATAAGAPPAISEAVVAAGGDRRERLEPNSAARRWWLTGAASLIGAGVAVAAMSVVRSDPPPQVEPLTESSRSPQSEASMNPAASPGSVSAPTEATARVATTPRLDTATARASAAPLPSSMPRTRMAAPGTAMPPASVAAPVRRSASKPNCSPAFYFDDGIKRFKPHCLKRP